jgi:RecJ-like exonuclease
MENNGTVTTVEADSRHRCPECKGEGVTRGNCRCETCDGRGWVGPEITAGDTTLTSQEFDSYTLGLQIEALKAQRKELLEACEWFVSQLESGELVRDITRDHQADWAKRMMLFATALNKAQTAIARARVS